MKHETPSTSESTKPIEMKIKHNVRNVIQITRMKYDDATTNPIWRTAAYWKTFFGYISTIYRPINAKFGKKKHNHVPTQVTWPKYQIWKIQDGGRPPFKNVFFAISQTRFQRNL